MILQTTALNVTQVPFPPEHEKKSLTRAGARDRLIRSREPGAGSREPGAGSREPGAGSREPGAGSREPGAGSREPGAGSREPIISFGFVMSAGVLHAPVEAVRMPPAA